MVERNIILVFLLLSLTDSNIFNVPRALVLKSDLGLLTDLVTATWPAQCKIKLGLIFLIILDIFL